MRRARCGPSSCWSMRTLLLLLLLVALVPALLVRTGIYLRWVQSEYDKEMRADLEVARAVAIGFCGYLKDVGRQQVAIGTAIASMDSPDSAQARVFLERMGREYPSVRGFHWIDLQGTIVNSSHPAYVGLRVGDRWHFREALARDGWVLSNLLQSRLDNAPVLVVASAVRDEAGRPLGVMAAVIDPDRLQRDILSVGRAHDGILSIVDRQGRVVATDPDLDLSWDQRLVAGDSLLDEALAGRDAVGVTYSDILKYRWAVARVPVADTGFVASAGRSVVRILAPLRYDMIVTGLASLAVIGASVLVAALISRRINRGLQRLQAHAAAVAEGDLEHRTEATGVRELQVLAEAFNHSATKRQQAENAMRCSEERFRLASQAIAGFVYDCDVVAGTEEYSGAILPMLGVQPAPHAPVGWFLDRVHPDDRPVVERIMRQIDSPGSSQYSGEYRIRHEDGHYVWISDRGRIVRDGSGRAVRVVGGVGDISQRRHAEEVLAEREALLQALVESLPFDVWAVDSEDRYILLNSVCRQHWGDIRGRRVDDIDVPREIKDLWRSNNTRAIGGEEIRGEVEYTIDGQPVTFYNILAPIRDGDRVRGAVGVNIDITDLKRAERQLRESEGKFRSLAENAQAIIGIVQGRRYIYVNPYLCRISGYTREELMAIDIADMIHPTFRQAVLERARLRQVGQPAPDHYEFLMITKDGHERWIDLSPTAITYRGQPAVIGVAYDITDRKRAERQLQELNETLEQRVAERTAEAEQRATQLRAMAAELSQAEERERRRLAQTLHDELQQLLAATKFHAGVLQGRLARDVLQERLKPVLDLLDEAMQVARSLTTELSPPILYDAGLAAGLRWLGRSVQAKHGLHVTVQADDQANPPTEPMGVFLFQAARELLFNVVKHARTDHAWVEMAMQDDQVHLAVIDKGIGFDPRQLAQRSGSGFGLFSIRERIELFGGRIQIDSAPGRGTQVTLILPATTPPSPSGTAGSGTNRKTD